MCGISGAFSPYKDIPLEACVETMASAITHRGPDMDGIWVHSSQKLGLSHRRLSIIDLSDSGRQPMESPSGRYVLVFNGEIYNFQDLREILIQKGHKFSGHSDSEVVLCAFEEWGIEEAVAKFNGMFAIAVYTREDNRLSLIRDRMGQKPLYYGWHEGVFYFASEMKAILAALDTRPRLDPDVAALYFQWRYVPDPHCIFEGFAKVQPGCIVQLDLDTPETLKEHIYWSVRTAAQSGATFEGDREDALNTLDTLLQQATRRRMIADVELGAFLSGGVDSALIVAMMQKQAVSRTFTIAFEDARYNEAPHARAVSDYLGSTHHEQTLSAQDALETVAFLPEIFDEPFGDPSAIPTYHVCRLARAHMSVALSGDGGDESFGGYSWYRRAAKINNIAFPLRGLAGGILPFLSRDPQVKKMASVLAALDDKAQYRALHSYWQTEDLLRYQAADLKTPLNDMIGGLMGYDSVMFLPGDVLPKVDRTSMAVSLEVRSPLLDHTIVEFAWRLPDAMRQHKSLLKDLLRRYVPDHLMNRPKQGFSIPHQAWLRGPLREWAGDLLYQDHGLLDMEAVERIWQDHVQERRNYGHLLWTIVMFQNWYKRWMCDAS